MSGGAGPAVRGGRAGRLPRAAPPLLERRAERGGFAGPAVSRNQSVGGRGRACVGLLNVRVLSVQTTGLVGLAVAENPHEVRHASCSVFCWKLSVGSELFVTYLHVWVRTPRPWKRCPRNGNVKMFRSGTGRKLILKGLIHVIGTYFVHVLFVACADFKNCLCVSTGTNQYLISLICNAKAKNSLNSVLHKCGFCFTGTQIFATLLHCVSNKC